MGIATKNTRHNIVAPKFDSHFHYCIYIGRINFLEKRPLPNKAYETIQCVKISEDPRAPNGAAAGNLVKYLAATKNNRLTFVSPKPVKFGGLCGIRFQRKLE